jgi:hypothetical protein
VYPRLGGSVRNKHSSLTAKHANSSVVGWSFSKLVASSGGGQQQKSTNKTLKVGLSTGVGVTFYVRRVCFLCHFESVQLFYAHPVYTKQNVKYSMSSCNTEMIHQRSGKLK